MTRDPAIPDGRVTLDAGHCITCSDLAVTATVVDVVGSTATVEADGVTARVGIELVGTVAVGELLLCHAGVALEKLAPSP